MTKNAKVMAVSCGIVMYIVLVALPIVVTITAKEPPQKRDQQTIERRLGYLETAIKGKADGRSTHICYTDAAPFEQCIPVAQVLRQLLDEKGVRAEWEGERRIPGKVVFKPVRK